MGEDEARPAALDERSMIVTLGPTADMSAMTEEMRDAGFEIERCLEAINIVTGRGKPHVIAQLRKMVGVVSVEREEVVHLDPSEVTDMGPGFAERVAELEPRVTGSSWKSKNWDD